MDITDLQRRYEKKKVIENNNRVTSNPLVSVCIQTYNHTNYIKQCLDSILTQQTTFDYEILLGEDASIDGTRQICIEFAERYKDKVRLFLHRRENNIEIGGKPTGRFNFLWNITHARGKYIAICEGDDYWTDPLKLQKQYDLMQAHPELSICYTLVNRSDGKDYRKVHRDRIGKSASYPFFYDLSFGIQSKGGPTLTMFMKRDSINLNLISNSIVQTAMADWPLEAMLLQNGNGCCIEDNTATYSVINSGASSTILNLEQYYKSRHLVCNELLNNSISKKNRLIIYKFLHRLYLSWALSKYHNNEISLAWKHCRKSFSLLNHTFKKQKMLWIKMYTYKSMVLHFIKLTILKLVPKQLQKYLPSRLQYKLKTV